MATLSKEERNAQIARETARAAGKVLVDAWLADHKEDFVPSDEHSQSIGQWLQTNNLELSYENLDAALSALMAQGISFAPPKGPRVDWAKRHAEDFDGSPESWAKLDGYLQRFNMAHDDARSLEQAFQFIRSAKGPKVFMSGSAAESGELPWIPHFIPQFTTKKELDAIPQEDFKKYYFGPDSAAFRNRIVAVQNK